MSDFVVAALGDWNKDVFDFNIKGTIQNWHFVSTREELGKLLGTIDPEYIFFLHWRWIVPKHILEKYECICFHMTDLPYGRGGSPLQNLIVRGHKHTILTALRMEEGLDTGPVYLKCFLSLEGKAEEIYKRASELSWEMIRKFISSTPKATPQEGEVTIFKRRLPEQSQIPSELSIEQIYDYIRMLDAPGYPHAFINVGTYQIDFTNAMIVNGELLTTSKITLKD